MVIVVVMVVEPMLVVETEVVMLREMCHMRGGGRVGGRRKERDREDWVNREVENDAKQVYQRHQFTQHFPLR